MSIEIYTVSQINNLIKDILESNFYGIWIEGEISSLRYSSTGHLYFSLVDEDASIGAIIYRNRLKNIKLSLKNGMKVVVFGSLGLYVKGGEYRIVVEHIRLSGIGKKFYDLEILKKEFKEKGYFDNKKPIPKNPNNIILLTSITGAAIHDMINILNRRGIGLNINIYPIPVQGEHAEIAIVEALKNINSIKENIDVVIIARGGGSNEDLWIFNSPKIAKALYKLKFPTISAIGHEIDFTLCDFVADLRAETPSAAAELITKSKIETLERLTLLRNSLYNTLKRIFLRKKEQFNNFSDRRNLLRMKSLINNRLMYVDNLQSSIQSFMHSKINVKKLLTQKFLNTINVYNPKNRLNKIEQKLTLFDYRLANNIKRIITTKKKNVDMYQYKLPALNPKNILQRGYTITTDKNNIPLKSYEDALNSTIIKTQFFDGIVVSEVKKGEKE